MSEYQFYEFRAIDRHLTSAEKKEISSWSSRTSASNTGVVFTYSYGDFPWDELQVVEKYFDAMFYLSNWGTIRLIFKIPGNLINTKELRQYYVKGLKVIEKGNHIIVDICIYDEENGRLIEGEDWLSSLVTLRDDIIAGDYRCLYLIWLKVSMESMLWKVDNVDESKEPEVPANLGALHEGLRDFVHLFEIDKDAIAVATERSPYQKEHQSNYADLISNLSDNEKDDFLKGLYYNEPLLNAKLVKRLKNRVGSIESISQEKRRTVAEIAERTREMREKREQAEKRRMEGQRLAKLRKTEQEALVLWQRVDLLIRNKNTKSYDEAIEILSDLKSLAVHKIQYNEFCIKVKGIKNQHSNLPALKSRIDSALLIEDSN